ncbi:MAG TPA: hypothetical protein VGS11_02960 [Candidatus Bathyarchaeia archaeon]|nr:hypothetical protein [Candidatus Bathyarchaeia archaeon]
MQESGSTVEEEETTNLVKWAKNRIEKNRRSPNAVSVIMANLTMLIITVVLSSLLFVWAIASFGAYQGGAGYWFSSRSVANQERVNVENVFFTGGSNNIVKIYIRNVGTIPLSIASIYVNSSLYQISPPQAITVGNVTAVPPSGVSLIGQTWAHGNVQQITVATARGTTVTTTWVA